MWSAPPSGPETPKSRMMSLWRKLYFINLHFWKCLILSQTGFFIFLKNKYPFWSLPISPETTYKIVNFLNIKKERYWNSEHKRWLINCTATLADAQRVTILVKKIRKKICKYFSFGEKLKDKNKKINWKKEENNKSLFWVSWWRVWRHKLNCYNSCDLN